MRNDIHPKYEDIVIACTSCGNKFLTGSTKIGKDKVEFEGKEYPVLKVEICSNCHPFYTGQQKIVDTEGRVERFNRKYGKSAQK